MKAAVLREIGQPLQLEDLELDEPGPEEVRVRIEAACEKPICVPGVVGEEPLQILGRKIARVQVVDCARPFACRSFQITERA